MQFCSQKKCLTIVAAALLAALFLNENCHAQMITGVWHGRINKKKTELKIIRKGDSLLGTSYYFESANNYRRYSIRGYFDANTNQALWWDDQLLEEKTGRYSLGSPGKIPYLSVADFNCPGSDKMFLDGNAFLKNDREDIKGPVHLEKTTTPVFSDEWDFIIDNYTSGGNNPELIDSVTAIASMPVFSPVKKTGEAGRTETLAVKPNAKEKTETSLTKTPVPFQNNLPAQNIIEDKFRQRKKLIIAEIPLAGDSIELRFYDNAEIDGDSISLFLNDRLIFQHIRLTALAYTIKLPVSELIDSNELVMVAENLGEIPPNTSYMVALCDGRRYEAVLFSTEQSSAVVRLVKPKAVSKTTSHLKSR
jgi:hypothetical protein